MNELTHDAWKRLGVAIRRERERQGLSQAELAERAGVSVGSVKNAETGGAPKRRKPYTLALIETALGWESGAVDAILEGHPQPRPTPPVVQPVVRVGEAAHAGQALRALTGAMEFSRVCEELGAPPAAVAHYEAAAEALLAATVSARQDRLTQEHFAAVAHSPGGDGGPQSDRAVVDDIVRSFDEEQAQG
ncbi:helix-turn-helix transcriptional regulator [Streptomyces olivoreticuli]